IQAIVNFLIIAFVVFCMVRMINLFRRKKETEEQAEAQEEKQQVSEELKVLRDIYALLEKTQGQPSAEEDGEQ
ncbi:MAG: MscL family protein, partial [Acutalibacteraceae bacterium]